MRELILVLCLLVGATTPARAACKDPTRVCIAVQLFVAPGVAQSFIDGQLTEANARLSAIDVAIDVVEVQVLPAASSRVESRAQRNALLRIGKQTPLRVFLVNRLLDADDLTRDRQGLTWRGGADFVVVVDDDAHPWVLAHELGHVFGLPHSTEYASIMNKTVRLILPQQLVYTERERPLMRRMLQRLLSTHKLVRLGPS